MHVEKNIDVINIRMQISSVIDYNRIAIETKILSKKICQNLLCTIETIY